jgi:basic membrane protein A
MVTSRKLRKALSKTAAVVIAVVVVIVAVAAGFMILQPPRVPGTTTSPTTTPTTTTPTTTPAPQFKLATILPGSIQDADFNTLGYLGTLHIKEKYGIDVAYSEGVSVADAERVASEYISLGYNIIFFHGGQFVSVGQKVASEHPDVVVIITGYGRIQNLPPNVWQLDPAFHKGFYVLGAIAANVTKTGVICYVSGVQLPFTISEVNAVLQALRDLRKNVTFIPVWTGDFNDPVKAKTVTANLIDQGCDVVMSSLNLANYGLFEAIKEANTTKGLYVLATTKYTDKSSMLPKNLITSYIYDYGVALEYIVGQILKGVKTGYYEIEFGRASYIKFPLKFVPSEVNEWAMKLQNMVATGQVTVVFNTTKP